MTKSEIIDNIETGIGSYKHRLESRKNDVIEFVNKGQMWNAQIAIGECIGFIAAIEELEFQLECMEVE